MNAVRSGSEFVHLFIYLCLETQVFQHYLLKVHEMKVAQLCPTLCDPMDCCSPWNSPGQNSGVGSLSLLQGIFPTQGSNPGKDYLSFVKFLCICVFVKDQQNIFVLSFLWVFYCFIDLCVCFLANILMS